MSAHNGQPPDLRAQLREARLAVRLERARAELTSVRANHFTASRLLREGYDGYTGYAWGDLVDPMDAFRDADLQRGFPFLDRGYARRDGYNRPFLWSDLDLDLTRSTARWLATKNKLAVGALSTLRNFTVKTGYKYEIKPKRETEDAAVAALCEHLNLVLEECHHQNRWPNREASCCWRSMRDGEAGLRHFPQPCGLTWVRFVEPETVYQPLGSPLSWTWGVETDGEDLERPLRYAVHYRGPDADIDFAPEDCDELPPDAAGVTWLKRNVDECVKRGLSDFYCAGDALDGANKLLRNMLTSGGVQAAIAWIQQYKAANAPTVGQQINQSRDQNRTYNPSPVTGQVVNYQKYEPGSIPKVGAGMEYVAAPIPVGASIHIQIVQAALRAIGARWCMPEYMISGDASNANYASTLVSGSPFVTAVECEQQLCFKPYFLRSQWIFIRNWCRARKCVAAGRVWTYEEVRALVEVHATPPQVAIANKGEEATVDQGDMDRGVLSVQERQRKLGLDPTKMAQEIKEEAPKAPAGKGPAGGGANGAPSPFGGSQGGMGGGLFGESVAERLAALRERYGADAAARVVNGAARLLEDAQRVPLPAPPPADPPPVIVEVQAPVTVAPPAPRAPFRVERDSHGRLLRVVPEPLVEEKQDSLGRWHDDQGHLISHGGDGDKPGAPSGRGKSDANRAARRALAKQVVAMRATPEGRSALRRGRELAAHLAGHVRGAVGAGVRKALDHLDQATLNGPSLILGGVQARSPAAVAHGVAQVVSLSLGEAHQQIFAVALAAHSLPGASTVGKAAGHGLAAAEKAAVTAVAFALSRVRRRLGLAESREAGPSDLDRAILAAAAEAMRESLADAYRRLGLPEEALPPADELARRLADGLAAGAKGGA